MGLLSKGGHAAVAYRTMTSRTCSTADGATCNHSQGRAVTVLDHIISCFLRKSAIDLFSFFDFLNHPYVTVTQAPLNSGRKRREGTKGTKNHLFSLFFPSFPLFFPSNTISQMESDPIYSSPPSSMDHSHSLTTFFFAAYALPSRASIA